MAQRFGGWLQWLLPGLGVKRWVLVTLVGLALVFDAIARWFVAEGSGIHVNELLDGIVDDFFSPSYLTGVLAVLGVLLAFVGVRMWLRSVVRVAAGRGPQG